MKDLIELRDRLQAEKDEIVAKAKPHRDEYEALMAQIRPLEERAREIARQFQAIERPRLGEIDTQLARIARALPGTRVLSQGEAGKS